MTSAQHKRIAETRGSLMSTATAALFIIVVFLTGGFIAGAITGNHRLVVMTLATLAGWLIGFLLGRVGVWVLMCARKRDRNDDGRRWEYDPWRDGEFGPRNLARTFDEVSRQLNDDLARAHLAVDDEPQPQPPVT